MFPECVLLQAYPGPCEGVMQLEYLIETSGFLSSINECALGHK